MAHSIPVAAQDLEFQNILDQLDADQPWQIEADKIVGRHDAEVIEAFGNVVLSRGQDYLKADYARYYRSTHWVLLQKSVEVRWRDDQLYADEAEFDLKNRVGWLKDGYLFAAKPHLYLSGKLIKRRFGDTYNFEQATITACDAKPAPWSFSARQGDLTIDGYAHLKDVHFQILDQTTLWSPVFTVPVKTTRQSGFLFPEVGLSDNHGVYLDLPLYWAIDEETDATFYEKFMSRRGLMQGFEFRRHNDFDSKSIWRFDWLYDSITANKESDEIDALDDDGLVRTNENRWWLRSKLDFRTPADWEIKLDLDAASDQNYLREFNSGPLGYEQTREEFVKVFGRDIPENDQNRTNTLLFYKSFAPGAVAAKMQFTQSVEHGHGNAGSEKDYNLQRFPEVQAYWFKDRILDLPLEAMAEGSLAHFYRRFGTKGVRLDLHPSLSLPLTTDYGSVISTLGLRQTQYSIEKYENQPQGHEDSTTPARGLVDFNLQAMTEFFRVYDLENESLDVGTDKPGSYRWMRLKHSIQPRLSYLYIPSIRQANKPYFDELDRIDPRNELVYSITQVFGRKRQFLSLAKDNESPELKLDYLDFARLRLEQNFDLREASRTDDKSRYPLRPFSDLLVELEVIPLDYIRLINRTWYSPYLGKITEHEHSLHLIWPDVGSLSFGVDFLAEVDEYKRSRNDEWSMLNLGATWQVTNELFLEGGFRADMEAERDLEKSLSIIYRHQCFDVRLMYSDTPLDQRVEMQINLAGINFF